MITRDNPNFFNIFCGTNSELYENFIMIMYEEMHKGVMGESIMNKAYMKSLVFKAIKNYEGDNPSTMDIDSLARTILDNVERNGWVENKYDSMNLEFVYNLTRNGRKVAQAIYQINKKDSITRHRNVRTTLGLLESYLRDGDPYDLIDALDASEHIISDLMDLINEINEKRKQLTKDATRSLDEAGENFLEYIEEEFLPSMDAYFNKDSITKNSIRIDEIINTIFDNYSRLKKYTTHMIERYPAMQNTESPVEDMLLTISDRIKSAKESKLPELATSTSNLFRHSEMVLRQVGALKIKRSSLINTLAIAIRDMDEDSQNKVFEQMSKKINIAKGRYFDPYKIKLLDIKRTRKINGSVAAEVEASDEVKREQAILRKIIESRVCLTEEVQYKIAQLLKNEEYIVNGQIPIASYKDLSASMQAVSVVSLMNQYIVRKTGELCVNEYFTTDEYIISKKGKEK
jgi:hypothetical protein